MGIQQRHEIRGPWFRFWVWTLHFPKLSCAGVLKVEGHIRRFVSVWFLFCQNSWQVFSGSKDSNRLGLGTTYHTLS